MKKNHSCKLGEVFICRLAVLTNELNISGCTLLVGPQSKFHTGHWIHFSLGLMLQKKTLHKISMAIPHPMKCQRHISVLKVYTFCGVKGQTKMGSLN